ncbi:DUF317 domain-containing protein [Kitasatospora sp. NPDC058048]|uniref:DUF317 domain-containing protein n=1 Tax=Kitasatospora sp. NPDC058048 TaxID=3346313 RepID=UPI0036D7C358
MTHTNPSHDMPMAVFPGYLAGPGEDLDTLFAFTRGRDDWLLTVEGNNLVACHESGTGLVILDRTEDSTSPRWTVASGHGRTSGLAWHATFDAATPAEVVMAAARRLAHGTGQPTRAEREQHLWSHTSHADTLDLLHTEAARARWSAGTRCCTSTLDAPDGTATLRTYRAAEGHGDARDLAYTLTAGARGHQATWWKAEFTRTVPTSIIMAALRTVTDPGRYTRRASRIPMLHRASLRTHPVARRCPEPALGR